MVFGLDYRLFRNPSTWITTFYEKDLLALQTVALQMMAMVPIDYTKFLPPSLHWLSPSLHRLAVFMLLIFGGNVIITALWILPAAIETVNLEQTTYLITVSIIGTFSVFNMQYYQWSYKSYLHIVDYVNANFLHRSAYGVTCVTGEPAYLLAKRFTFYWTSLCTVSTFQWVFLALFFGYRLLPVNITYTFLDQRQTPYYQILFVLHSGFQYVSALGFSTGANVLLSVVVIICGQFDMLFCSLKNIRNTAMMINGNYEDQLK